MVYCISIHQYIIVIPLLSLAITSHHHSHRTASLGALLQARPGLDEVALLFCLGTDRSGDLGNIGPMDSQLEVPKHLRKTKWKIKKKHLISNFTKILEIRENVEKLSLVDFTNCAFTTQQIQIELDCECVCLHGYLGY